MSSKHALPFHELSELSEDEDEHALPFHDTNVCFVNPSENFPSSIYYRNLNLKRPSPWSSTPKPPEKKSGEFDFGHTEDSLEKSDTALSFGSEQDLVVHLQDSANFNSNQESGASKFGTWDGVFTSCFLNIMGVILFLRLGWCIGSTGLLGTVQLLQF